MVKTSRMRIPDGHILMTFRADKASGIRLLFDAYYSPMLTYAIRLLDDQSQAKDVIQDLFTKLWEKNYLLEVQPEALSAYLMRSVKNACTNTVSKKALKVAGGLERLDIPEQVFEPSEDQQMERLLFELSQLPERTRMAAEAVMLHGKKYKEAAEEMSVSVNTIKFLLKSALKKLRENLHNENE